jgi:hypothetical protein
VRERVVNTGFKVKLPPPPPPVLAAEGETTCREGHPFEHARWDRPAGHGGGHLNANASLYWQAAS